MTTDATGPLAALLAGYQPRDEEESADLERLRDLVRATADPWRRSIPLHVTASALIVHPDSGRVLLRWHQRQRAWLQVGGHADAGENDPVLVAGREAREETGLTDLVAWPGPQLLHVVIVPVAAGGREPAHEHADLRFVLATGAPDTIRPERPEAPLRWLVLPEAIETTTELNLRRSLARVAQAMAGAAPLPR